MSVIGAEQTRSYPINTMCVFNAPCFLYSLIPVKSNLNASHTRPLSRVESLWSHATRAKNPKGSWRADATPRTAHPSFRFVHSTGCAPFPPSPCPTFLNPSFPSSWNSYLLLSVISNASPCPLLAFPPSRCTSDSLAAPKRLAPARPIPAKGSNLPPNATTPHGVL